MLELPLDAFIRALCLLEKISSRHQYTLPEANSEWKPLKNWGPKRKGSYSNHPFSGANLLLVSGRVYKVTIFYKWFWGHDVGPISSGGCFLANISMRPNLGGVFFLATQFEKNAQVNLGSFCPTISGYQKNPNKKSVKPSKGNL